MRKVQVSYVPERYTINDTFNLSKKNIEQSNEYYVFI